jgi:hypothetical protein
MKVDPVRRSITVEALHAAVNLCSDVEEECYTNSWAVNHDERREYLANAAGAAMCRRAIMQLIEQIGTQKIAG